MNLPDAPLRVFYAADEAESQQNKSDLEREINAVCKSLEHYPNGFRLVMSTLPGTVEVTEEFGLHPCDHPTAKVNISRKVLYTTAKPEQGDARCEAEHTVENLS